MNSQNRDVDDVPGEYARLKPQSSPVHCQPNVAPVRPPSYLDDRIPSHSLLILSDSALPLGSFAFSSGLESYLAHHSATLNAQHNALPQFMDITLTSLATTALPYLVAAYTYPSKLLDLDETFDACTLCAVGKRASIAQGRALLTLWERALKGNCQMSGASEALTKFSKMLKVSMQADSLKDDQSHPSGHFALVWSVICRASSIPLPAAAYTFLLNHAKAIVSAAVRASMLGPYAAQGLLGSPWLKERIEALLDHEWDRRIEDAAQGVPLTDIWVGRHEMLYSRIFNS